MLTRLQNHLEKSQLIPVGSRVLVGYSGGADSGCLVHLLKRLGIDVIAGHLHHGQREEADRELVLCQAQCEEWGVPFMSGRADVPLMSQEFKMGLEEAGRQARYHFLERAAMQFECQVIATAHTRTDSVETALFNLIRGTGPAGLCGVPERRYNIIRPLLAFSRDETRSYCEENGIWFHNDPSNAEIEFSRARIRHRIMPEMREVNGMAEASIARAITIIAEEDRFMNGIAGQALEQVEHVLNGSLSFLTRDLEFAFDRQKLESYPPVLLRRMIRLAFEALGAPLDFDQTEGFIKLFVENQHGSFTAEGGNVVGELGETLLHVRKLEVPESFRFPVTIPGETVSEVFGWKIEAFASDPSVVTNLRTGLSVEIDKSKIRGDLYFRSAQTGDKIQPLGFDGNRLLSDLLGESKLTHAARARLPIICDFLGPIWAPGVCLSHRINKEPLTSEILSMKFLSLMDE